MIWNPAAETQSKAERASLQLARLRETLAWASDRVPFYREQLAGTDVRSLPDLGRLPRLSSRG
jgi:phenylacetate-coenzyme A ligase PaaK-like adenylate-forming protein